MIRVAGMLGPVAVRLGPALLNVRPVDVGPEGLVNVIEAWCEVCDVRWFPPSFAVGRSRAADE